jgi:RNA polymerase sigma factor (TIGR02999 family)
MSDKPSIPQSRAAAGAASAPELLDLVYAELRKLAAAKVAAEPPGQTLQPTALVHEAWLRLSGGAGRKWNDRTHFFAAAAEAMRRILVDNARRKRAQRHGGGQLRVEMPEIAVLSAANDDQLLAVNDALEKFAAVDRQKAELIKLRYFIGMTTEEAAQALGISVPTASRYWVYARAWLADEIRSHQGR